MKVEEYYTVEQVAQLLGVSSRTIRNLINRGRFPGAHRIDPDSKKSTWRIPVSTVDKFQEKQQKK
jgi:excisionase family DNA binding protein